MLLEYPSLLPHDVYEEIQGNRSLPSRQNVKNINCRNLDPLTENYNISFYLHYLATWPDLFLLAENTKREPIGYILGKAEGTKTDWHGHVSALTVHPGFRRIGMAAYLMKHLEVVSDSQDCYFVDLFVRKSNQVAIKMYEKFGYRIYRRVLEYYSGVDDNEDAYDMRKSMSLDPHKLKMQPLKHPIRPEQIEWP